MDKPKPYSMVMVFHPGPDPKSGCSIQLANTPQGKGVMIEIQAAELEQFTEFMNGLIDNAKSVLKNTAPKPRCPVCNETLVAEGWQLSCPECEWLRVIQPVFIDEKTKQ